MLESSLGGSPWAKTRIRRPYNQSVAPYLRLLEFPRLEPERRVGQRMRRLDLQVGVGAPVALAGQVSECLYSDQAPVVRHEKANNY